MKAKIKLKILKNFDKYKEGDKIEVLLDCFWRNRIKDKDVSLDENNSENKKSFICKKKNIDFSVDKNYINNKKIDGDKK